VQQPDCNQVFAPPVFNFDYGLLVVVVIVVSGGAASPLLHVVVVCFCTIPGAGSLTVFFCITAPLSQVVTEVRDPGAGVIVVVCVPGTVVTTGGVTWTTDGGTGTVWTTDGGAGTVSTSLVVLEKQPATINPADVARAGNKIR
jgi:hypothetical protein